MSEVIKSVPLYDKNGRCLGTFTGRTSDHEKYKTSDLVKQIESDRRKIREQEDRARGRR